MTASAAAVASIRFRAGIGGEPIVQEARPSPAHTFQPARWGATIVASPSSPVAGDHLGVTVTVGVGCCAEIRSSEPTVARPAEPGDPSPSREAPSMSSLHITATVASDAMLTWRPEPGVATDGSRHRQEANVEMAGSARLLWRDEFVLESRDGTTGTWSSRLRVVRDGWPVVCNELAVGPSSPLWESPAVLEGARALSLMVVVDPEPDSETWCTTRTTEESATGVALPLAGPGMQIVAWGDDLEDCRAVIERMVARCGIPEWAAGRWRNGRALDVVG